jgi:hypothetical protein
MSEVIDSTESEPITSTVGFLLEELRTTYHAAVSNLESERAALEEESQGIQTAADELRLLLPAKAREAERAADVLLLEGKTEDAQAKREEQQQAERAPAEMEQRRGAIAARLTAIDAEKRNHARRVFQEWFPELREALVAEQREMVSALDSAWDGCNAFAIETGTQERPALVTHNTRSDLTARETGPEKTTFLRLLDWFGGRR